MNIEQEKEKLKVVVYKFTAELHKKLFKKIEEGYEGWNEIKNKEMIKSTLIDKLKKGLTGDNLVDIANYCMFLWNIEKTISEENI